MFNGRRLWANWWPKVKLRRPLGKMTSSIPGRPSAMRTKNGDMDNVDISSLYLPALVTVEVFSTSNILNWDLMSGLLAKRWWMTRHEKLRLYFETMALKAILNRTPDRRLQTLLLVLTGGKQGQRPVNEKEASGHQNILGTCASPALSAY